MKKSSLEAIAAKAGMSGRTARKYLKIGKLPSELKSPRTHRTRKDPFAQHIDIIENMITEAPQLQAKTLHHYLMEQYPDVYKEGHLRSLQRRVLAIKASCDIDKDVIFPQDIKPGKESQSDWFSMNSLKITIAGQMFDHLLFHFMLPYSRWEDIMICNSESFESLSKGFAESVTKLGGTLPSHRTDNLSAATKKDGGSRSFTAKWQQFMDHYNVTPSRNNPGASHENGSVEKSHDLLRSAINQHLILRKSRDFDCLASYQRFLDNIIEKRNNARKAQVMEELHYMQALPKRGWNDPKILNVRVTPDSTISILGCIYSVPSRLISYHLRAYAYTDRIDLYYGSKKLETIPRSDGKSCINYLHIIDGLIRKPGAFANYKYKESLYPSLEFRKACDELIASKPATGHKDYLKLLQLAKCYGQSEVLAALELCIERHELPLSSTVKDLLQAPLMPLPQNTRVNAPNLSEYDSLLISFMEVA